MKRLLNILFIISIALLSSCREEKVSEAPVQLSTQDLSLIRQTSATGSAYITVNDGVDITETGFCWSSAGTPTTADFHLATVETSPHGLFSAVLPALTPATTYHVRAYASDGSRTWYGNTVSFTTQGDLRDGWCVIDRVSGITPTSAEVYMEIADNGGRAVEEYGICYNTAGDPTTADTKSVSQPGGNSYTAALADLAQDTEYFVKPYFITSEGTTYGDQRSFRTLNFIKSVNVFPGFRAAYMMGQVVMDAGSETTERGVCWATHPEPTVADSRRKVGKGVGSFYTLVGGLEKGTTYYMRSYAVNEGGTFYGLPIEFTTRTGDILPGFDLSQMVRVEAGTFDMGEPDTDVISSCITANTFGKEPVHSVTISKDFYICKYQVTNEQLCTFLNVYQSTRRRNLDQALYNSSGRTFSFNVSGSSPNLRYAPVNGAARKPASNFTWGCGEQFLEWLSAELGVEVRMPTEAEWEFAARGGNLSRGYTYSGSDTSSEVAVLTSSSRGPAIVGSLKPNELGIYDMSGNVFEYCADAFDMDFYLPQVGKTTVDPFLAGASNAGKVIRGGSFRHGTYFRVSARGKTTNESDCGNHSGMRMVMTTLPATLD